MALYRNLWNLSVEEDDVTGAAGGEAESAIAPEEAAEQATEVQEQAEVVESDAVALEESMEAIEELQDTVETNEEVLENNPEAVTDEMVAASNECYAFSMGVLGIKRDDFLANRISLESYSSPSEKLQVSTEAMKEHVKNAIERIKLFFKQLGVQIKKLYVKILAMFNTAEKRAKELKKEINKDKYKNKSIGRNDVKNFQAIEDVFASKGLLILMILEGIPKGILSIDVKSFLNNISDKNGNITPKIVSGCPMANFVNVININKDLKDADPFDDSSYIPLRVFPYAMGTLYIYKDDDDRAKVTYKVVKLDKISIEELMKLSGEDKLSKDLIEHILDFCIEAGRVIKKLNDTLGREYDKIVDRLEKEYKIEAEDETDRSEKSKLKMELAVGKIFASRYYSETALMLMQAANAGIQLASAWKSAKESSKGDGKKGGGKND